MTAPTTPVLLLPGWQGSGPDHWQSRWEQLHGHLRVEQHDWQRPLRGEACREGIRSDVEDGQYSVARGLDDAPGGRLDRVPQQRVMPSQRSIHRVGMPLP